MHTLATYIDDELAGFGVLLFAQILSTGLEVIEDILLVAMSACVMPLQPILSTTPACNKLPLVCMCM